MAEKSGPQTPAQHSVYITEQSNTLHTRRSPATFKRYRELRLDPTIALARELIKAPILSSEWRVDAKDGAPEGAKEFIEEVLLPMRIHIMTHVLNGCIDFGFAPFEKVFEEKNGKVQIRKLKPLLQDITDILVDEHTGSFLGFQQGEIQFSVDECLNILLHYEGTDWYGIPMLERVRKVQDGWDDVNEAAKRYDTKVAGTNIVVRYPPGTSMRNGVETDNFLIAKEIGNSMLATGQTVVPNIISELNAELESQGVVKAWDIEFLSDGGSGAAAFESRLKYHDVCKVRGLGLPERSVLEGQFGTKAESETHTDFAILGLQLLHQIAVNQINWHLVNQLLRINWGPEADGVVELKPAPITDTSIKFLREVYQQLIMNPESALLETGEIDMDSLRDHLGLPTQEQTSSVLPGNEGATDLLLPQNVDPATLKVPVNAAP